MLVIVLFCHDMKGRDTLQIRIGIDLRQRLARLRSHHHLNVSSWARQVLAEALDRDFPEVQTTQPVPVGPPAEPFPGFRPCRLPDGSWGSAIDGPAADALPEQLAGSSIQVTARNGSSWTAIVSAIVERSPGRVAVADSGRPTANRT